MAGKSNKLWKGIMIGAAIGAAMSLLDQETRKMLRAKNKLEYFLKDLVNMAENVNQHVHKCRQSLEQLSEDISFIAEKIKEINEKTPEVIGFVKETFMRRKDDDSQL
ncbi:gas vesicle protein [Anoxybacillus calidus]|jgi:gas vesicle protein|uniref:Gas vesicle protein n=1 Tax=[Anoxybacillus] calidus TaxID=575178 RepID=A0A7V9Z1V1_9BACL|nr:YtxH domain-containing protein [Anoxybacillus calidus]MBA2872549.1 gas vesicle protein [Anoxybacillus calidus]